MPPKSKEFHRIAREMLAPVLAEQGFSRPRTVGRGGWARHEGAGWLVIWTQLNRRNYGDAPDGYAFVVEMQLGDEPVAGVVGPRGRLYRLLSDEERLAHLAIHNRVVVKLRPDLFLLEGLGDEYFLEFQPRSIPFDRSDDVWFRYADEEDVRRWLAFVAQVLPATIARFSAAASDQHGRRPRPDDLLW